MCSRIFIVNIDHLSDSQLAFFGWLLTSETDEFAMYTHIRTSTEQIVHKESRRFLVIDDVNDAQQMSKDSMVLIAPDEEPSNNL